MGMSMHSLIESSNQVKSNQIIPVRRCVLEYKPLNAVRGRGVTFSSNSVSLGRVRVYVCDKAIYAAGRAGSKAQAIPLEWKAFHGELSWLHSGTHSPIGRFSANYLSGMLDGGVYRLPSLDPAMANYDHG
jgi:hypothetical protein